MTSLSTEERGTAPARGPRAWLRGQLLAIGLSTAVVAVQVLVMPVFGHAPYLIAVPVLLWCARPGGLAPMVTAIALTAVGGAVADLRMDLPLAERAVRLVLFLGIGLATAVGVARFNRMKRRLQTRLARQRQREALLESSLDTVADAIVVFDAKGVIQSFSRASERLFGWPAEEARGRGVGMLLAAVPDVGDGNLIEHFVGSHREVMARRKDRSEFPVELRVEEVHIGDGRFFTGVVRDMTTLHEAERRAEELRGQLTQVWSLNSMGEMASVLAHELNQPLSAVANYLRAARTLIANLEIEDDDLIDAVSRAGDQAVRAGEIIRTMRDLATRGGTQQRPESLSAIVGEIDFIVGLLARDAGVRVIYDLYKGEDFVLADRIQIQQLLVNLVRNAIESMTKYPIRQLNIATRPDADGGIITTISDSGPGVDPSVADRLFQPLASTKPTGMGLGLSISTAIIENHRGRIWVEPSSLGGAAFCFLLARAGRHGDDAVGGSDRVHRR